MVFSLFEQSMQELKTRNSKIEPKETKFRTLDLAVEFYQMIQTIEAKGHLKDQLIRAASSISLNLAEGNAKRTVNEKRHFFQTAYASLRECKTIFKLLKLDKGECVDKADHLGASLYRLINSDIKCFKSSKQL